MALRLAALLFFVCAKSSVGLNLVSTHEKPLKAAKANVSSQDLAVGKLAQPTGRPEKNESAAEATGVAANEAGDLNAFVAALITNIISVIIFFSVGSCLRRKYPLVYSKEAITLSENEQIKAELDDAPEELKPMLEESWKEKVPFQPDEEAFWGWWTASNECTIEQAIKYRGLDQAMLIEFANTSMKILGAIGVPLVFVMGPIHCFLGGYRAGAPGTEEADYLSYWGMANVVDNHPYLYWVHAFMTWYVVTVTQRLIYGAMRDFMTRRNAWLKALPEPRCTTILVEGIPKEYRGDKEITEYFDSIFDKKGTVKEAFVVKQTKDLLAVVALEKAALDREEKARHAKKMAEQGEGGDVATATAEVTAAEEALKELQAKVKEERANVFKSAADEDLTALGEGEEPVWNLSKGFVTFATRRDAELAKMMIYTPNAEEFQVSIPPDPTDIIYTDLQKDPLQETIQTCIGYALIAAVFWAYLPTVVYIAYYTSIQTLAEYSDTFKAMAEDEATAALWDGLVNALALQLFIAFVPTFFVMIFSNFFVLKAEAWLQHKIQDWYFYFQVIFILLVTAVGSSLVDTLEALAENPLSIFSLLASNMPNSTHFYLNFLPLQWVTHAQNLVRNANLFKFLAFSKMFGFAPAIKKMEPEDQDYYGLGSRSSRFAFFLVLTLCFASLSPLIITLGFANFWICRIVYGYLCVFCEKKKPDLGGVFYVTQLQHVQQGMFIYLILMTGVLLERASDMWPGFIAGLCLIFMRESYAGFKRQFRWESLSFEELKELDSSGAKAKQTGLKYEQPELLGTELA